MCMAKGYRPREPTASFITSTKPGRLLRLLALSVLFLLLLVSVADAAGYTVRPSQNIGKEPFTSVSGETVREIDPIPLWLSLLLCVFPHLTVAPIETLIPLKAASYLGYRRICRKNALDNQRRLGIFHFIKEHPGLYFRELLRNMPLAKGSLEYHVNIMESEGLLRTIRRKGKTHYFTADSLYPAEDEVLLSAMRSDSLKKILAQIHQDPGIYGAKIAENVGLSRATVSGHVKHLEELGIVKAEREGRCVVYTISNTYSQALTEYVDRCP